jgi:hypothetical protein
MTDREITDDMIEALYRWSLNGFCDDSGDVEAPTGWFCRIDVDRNCAQPILEGTDLDVDDILGAWMLYQDNLGRRAAELYDTETARDRAWGKLERLYGKWASDE